MNNNTSKGEPYRQRDHSHCWAQGKEPACGIPIERHTVCCLCELPRHSRVEEDREDEILDRIASERDSGVESGCKDPTCSCKEGNDWDKGN